MPNVVRLVRLCRDRGVSIWYTRQVHYPDDTGRKRRRTPSHLDRRGVRLELCWRGTWDAELLDEIGAEVRPEDEVVVKHRPSAFYNTTFESELRMKGVQVLIVAGTTSSFCVESTVRDAYARDFDVLLPADCTADTEEAAQQSVLTNVRRFFGMVTSVDELSEMLEPQPAAAIHSS